MRLVLTYRLLADPTPSELSEVTAVPGLRVLDSFPGVVMVRWDGEPAALQDKLPAWRIGHLVEVCPS